MRTFMFVAGVVVVGRAVHAGDPCAIEAQGPVTPPLPSIQDFSQMGRESTLRGDVAVVGEWNDDEGEPDSGAAHVYRLVGGAWTFEQTLKADPPVANARFGNAMAVDGDTIAVGASNETFDGEAFASGAVYIFTRDPGAGVWSQTARIEFPNSVGDEFGDTVALEGATLAIGAPGETSPGGGSNDGAIHIYEGSGSEWELVQSLYDPDPDFNGRVGDELAMDGDLIITSSIEDNFTSFGAGAGLIYGRTEGLWLFQAKVGSNDAENFDPLGDGVAIDGATVVVGCSECDGLVQGNAGTAYVFDPTGEGGYALTKKLGAPLGANGDNFGDAIAIRDGLILVSADGHDAAGGSAGAAYLFKLEESGWEFDQKYLPPGLAPGDNFGNSISISNARALIGASGLNGSGFNTNGGAWFLNLNACGAPPPDCPDTNGDNTVDSTDLNTLLAQFGDAGERLAGDVDGDGDVDSADLNALLASFGQPCP